MDRQADLKGRTKQFAIAIVRMVDHLPQRSVGWAISKQILRSATSVAANYRAAARSRSRAEFVARMGVVMEEADETQFWLELIVDCGLLDENSVKSLCKEATELVAIFSASYRTARANKQ